METRLNSGGQQVAFGSQGAENEAVAEEAGARAPAHAARPRARSHAARPRARITGTPFTVAKPIRGSVDELEKLLRSIGNDLRHETVLNLRELELVHFLRWVIVPGAEKRQGPHLLVFGSDYDGTLEEHLSELWERAGRGAGLDRIYAFCEGAPTFATPADLVRYFSSDLLPAAAAYRGTRDRSVRQIRGEDELQQTLAGYVDGPHRGSVSSDPQRALAEHVRKLESPPVDLDEELLDTTTLLSKLAHGPAVWLLVVAGVGLLLVPGLLFFGLVWVRERTEPEDASAQGEPDAGKLGQLKGREDYKVQNQLTHLVPIKPGMLRMFSLRLVLWAIDLLAKNYFDRGNLGGIPSIHYARWMILKEQRQLLFFSNFDGSWESYLGDFVDQAASGLTGVWSNTVGFPRSLFLVLRGARDEERFKNWTRAHQVETQIWYSAYPNLSVQNVNENTVLRRGLAERPPEGEPLRAWLRTL